MGNNRTVSGGASRRSPKLIAGGRSLLEEFLCHGQASSDMAGTADFGFSIGDRLYGGWGSEERNQEPMAQTWDSPHTRAHTCVDVGVGSLLSCGNLQVSRVGGKCLYSPHWFYFKSTMTTQGIG